MVRFASGSGVSVSVALGGVGSVGEDTDAVLLRMPVSEAAVCMTSVTTCGPAPAARVPMSALNVPLAPTAVLSVRVQPFGRESDTNVVPAGSASLKTTLCASDVPGLPTVIVYVTLLPGV